MTPNVMNVSQLNRYVKSLLEGDPHLSCVFVTGEISNYKLHAYSGHAYFSLKDKDSVINCVCFKSSMERLRFALVDGMSVLCQGRISLYEKTGNYQLYVTGIRPEGIGEAALSFEQLKEKLQAEGLFDPAKKRPLPTMPIRIAVVTAKDGAAVRDVMNILERRFPLCQPLLCPVLVQGAGAAEDITKTLKRIYERRDVDLIILGRGGGASEDLSAFNDETLVRTVAAAPIPVISAVGHEVDFTLCDFAADFRAPTPSAAAECAVPDQNDLFASLAVMNGRLKRGLDRLYSDASLRLDAVLRSGVLTDWNRVAEKKKSDLALLCDRLTMSIRKTVENDSQQLVKESARLDALSPLKTLMRGFAVAEKDGVTVRSVKDINKEDIVSLRLADGTIHTKVI